MELGVDKNLLAKLSRARRYHYRPTVNYWAVVPQTCYMGPCAGFLVIKDLRRKVQLSEYVQKMELGVEPILFAQVILTVL